eukprot:CAMPEP_0171754952 /NCGR_PEP_ID=MMETSP0991-20121206/44166_1 /TAXON_ID=483369 /ORGANISM="non described non described, Strain CCMP2098" /LENGTH=149 /DNA_ID=CAMNT_0012356921 /DNA_START=23 /DNA_END=472 /DNA_ORIENTATION=+
MTRPTRRMALLGSQRRAVTAGPQGTGGMPRSPTGDVCITALRCAAAANCCSGSSLKARGQLLQRQQPEGVFDFCAYFVDANNNVRQEHGDRDRGGCRDKRTALSRHVDQADGEKEEPEAQSPAEMTGVARRNGRASQPVAGAHAQLQLL